MRRPTSWNRIKREYFYALWPRMNILGFIGKPRQHKFLRAFKGGVGSVGFQYDDTPSNTVISMFVAIRFEELEMLKNRNRPDLSRRDKLLTFSFEDEYGDLLVRPSAYRWSLGPETHVEDLAEEVYSGVLDAVVPYLDRYSDMKHALEYMLEADHTDMSTAAINAVGLAFLLKRKDFNGIVADRTRLLEQRFGTGAQALYDFVRTLETAPSTIVK